LTDNLPTRASYGASSAHFSEPYFGWVRLTIEGLIASDDSVAISEVYDPFDDLIPFLEAMAADQQAAHWEIDEEGRLSQLLFIPSDSALGVPPQLLIVRDIADSCEGWPKETIGRCFVDARYVAMTIYFAFRMMADNPARDRRHWEGMSGDNEEDGSGRTWSLSDIRSATLDDMLQGK
jgi:hypothetical protein